MSARLRPIVIGCVVCILTVISVPLGGYAQQNAARVEIPADLLAHESRNLDETLLISVGSVISKRESDDLLLIDVRDRRDFERLRVPYSINIPLYAVKTKPFLKSKSLILINNGFCYSPLEPEITRLGNSGFSRVHALKGGLSAWRRGKAPLEGDPFARAQLDKISPREFFSERHYADVVAVDIAEKAHPLGARLIPQTVSVPYGQAEEEFMAQLRDVAATDESRSFRRIVIYNAKGECPEALQRLIEKQGIENVFYLQGGLEGYRMFLWRQSRLRLTKNAKTTVRKCNVCP